MMVAFGHRSAIASYVRGVHFSAPVTAHRSESNCPGSAARTMLPRNVGVPTNKLARYAWIMRASMAPSVGFAW